MEPLNQPDLEAGNYRLRPFAASDAGLVRDAAADPLIPLITSVPRGGTDEEILRFIGRQQSRRVERSGFSYATADAGTDQALGQIGLWLRNLDQGRAGIGYWVGAAHRNQGVARAALDAISRFGLGLPGIHRLELYVEPWNVGSWRAAERCGYTREGLLRSWRDVGGQRRNMYMYSRVD